jgi:hypothetical protein
VSYRWKARALLRNKPYLDDHGNLNKEWRFAWYISQFSR